MPRVSVIVPNYKHAPYLPRRIDSILRQTWRDFELLILDDASPDESLEVINRYRSDPRVRVCANERNSGSTYKQWQKGLALTAGEYVWIAESDDFADPHLLQQLVTALDQAPHAGLAVCNTIKVDEHGAAIGRYFASWNAGTIHGDYDLARLDTAFTMEGRDYCRRFMVPWNTIPNASAVLFRRTAIDSIGGPVTDMKLCGDWMTYCRILMRYDIARVPAHLNYFRQHDVNVRSNTKAPTLVAESIAVQAYVARELKLTGDERFPAALRHFCAHVLVSAERIRPDNRVPVAKFMVLAAAGARFGLPVFLETIRILARELGGRARRRMGLTRT